jgi:hypothetical protein
MSEVVMARQVLTLKTIRRELKDDARPAIDQAVSSIETLYEIVSRAHEIWYAPQENTSFLNKFYSIHDWVPRLEWVIRKVRVE